MQMRLEGSCRCGAISFSVDSHTPYPYQRCYCSICRKSAGGGGYAINIMAIADTLKLKGKSALGVWNAPIDGHKGSADRHYCKHCGTPLWVSDEQWPELVHPFASAIDTELPKPPSSVHLLLRDKASWVEPQIGPNDDLLRRLSRIVDRGLAQKTWAMDCMTAPLRKTNGRSTREIARGQPRILGQISVGDPVQNFLALKPPADDRGPCAVTLRLRGHIFGNAPNKPLRG